MGAQMTDERDARRKLVAEGPAAAALERVLGGPRAVLVLGKGGVGKTTVAGMLAGMMAAHGERVRRVELGAGAGTSVGESGIWHIDPDEAFERAAEPIFGSRMLVRAAFGHSAVRELLAIVPGLREYAMLVVALGLDGRRAPGEKVVVDMPATGHGLTWMTAAAQLARVAGRGRAFEQAQRVDRALRQAADTACVVVTESEPLIRAETEELKRSLMEGLGRGPDLVVVNRVPRNVATESDLADLGRIAAGMTDPAVAHELTRLMDWHMRRRQSVADAMALGPDVVRVWLDDESRGADERRESLQLQRREQAA